MVAGMARLEVSFHVDENNLLQVKAVELTTGIEQSVEVKSSYGLTDDQIEEMLIDAIDHGDEDFEARRWAEIRVEASRMMLATEKAMAADRDLLQPDDQQRIEQILQQLQEATGGAPQASRVQMLMNDLDAATYEWAGRRMNRAIQAAISGKNVGEVAARVADAAGVEAQLEAEARQRSEQR
jgi:molecular chaperone HscA